jgi:hypothetical protein
MPLTLALKRGSALNILCPARNSTPVARGVLLLRPVVLNRIFVTNDYVRSVRGYIFEPSGLVVFKTAITGFRASTRWPVVVMWVGASNIPTC